MRWIKSFVKQLKSCYVAGVGDFRSEGLRYKVLHGQMLTRNIKDNI